MTITWQVFGGKTSEVHEVGSAPHLATDLFQFPTKTAWKNPHENRKCINASEHPSDYSIPRSAFELHPSRTSGPAVFGSKSPRNSQTSALFGENKDAISPSMQAPEHRQLAVKHGTSSSKDYSSETGRNPAPGSLENLHHQGISDDRRLRAPAQGPMPAGSRRLQEAVARNTEPAGTGSPGSYHSDEHHQRRSGGETPKGGRRPGSDRPSNVFPSNHLNEAQRQQDEVVDVHAVPKPLGATHPGRSDPRRNPTRIGSSAGGSSCGNDLQRHLRESPELLPMGADNDGPGGRNAEPPAAPLGKLHPAEGGKGLGRSPCRGGRSLN